MTKTTFTRRALKYNGEKYYFEMKETKVPSYLIFSTTSSPIACGKLDDAISAAMRYSKCDCGKDEEFRVFDAVLGGFIGTYKNGERITK